MWQDSTLQHARIRRMNSLMRLGGSTMIKDCLIVLRGSHIRHVSGFRLRVLIMQGLMRRHVNAGRGISIYSVGLIKKISLIV
jgi:hypothetical protein